MQLCFASESCQVLGAIEELPCQLSSQLLRRKEERIRELETERDNLKFVTELDQEVDKLEKLKDEEDKEEEEREPDIPFGCF